MVFSALWSHLPAGGEIVLFDRSWYNRAGVERVMGFCSEADGEEFFRTVPEFERMLVGSGIILVKYWFSITDEEQNLRFLMRIHDPLKQWKLSPMDLESRRRWEHYTYAKEDNVPAHTYSGSPLVGDRGRRQEEGPIELHRVVYPEWAIVRQLSLRSRAVETREVSQIRLALVGSVSRRLPTRISALSRWTTSFSKIGCRP